MNKLKIYLLILVISIPMMIINMPVKTSVQAATGGDNNFTKVDGVYNIRIEAQQWEYKAYDLNLANEKGVNLDTASEAIKEQYAVTHRIQFPDAVKGDSLHFALYSRDVQHGFSINELGIAVALNRPTPGEEFGAPKFADANLTASQLGDSLTGAGNGVTYSAFCHIFCGLGHPDMKIKLVLGGGAVEFGPYVFWGALFLNFVVFAITLKSIVSKVTLVPKDIPAKA